MSYTFIFLNASSDGERPELLAFRDPVEIVTCDGTAEVEALFRRVEKMVSSGFYAAGFLSYELGYHFMDIPFKTTSDFPLLSFGIFDRPEKIGLDDIAGILPSRAPGERDFGVTNGRYSITPDIYYENVNRVKDHLAKGNTYQVNYTFKYKFELAGSPALLFKTLIEKQRVPYAAILDTDRWSILSLSPELFFRRAGRQITVRPMKGTIGRGSTPEEDDLKSAVLASSAKNRAENIMIVDLLRNDLGKVAETGSVRPAGLFSIEKYTTLFQMTSTVTASLKKDISWYALFHELFPSGSVTGAPKKRTMEIIKSLESEERKIYTGAIGYITPSEEAVFNIAIRTILTDKATGESELGIGSGILFDSDTKEEYEECLLKGAFLTGAGRVPDFDVIETILWEDGEYFLLDLHLERLEKSARHFSFPYDAGKITSSLAGARDAFDRSKKYRLRLSLERTGAVGLTVGALENDVKLPVKVRFSDKRTEKDDPFLRHKTTRRYLYESELSKCREAGFFECLFLNSSGEVTEGAITNVMIRKNGEYFTPPVSCGLLGGVYREYLLRSGGLPLKEKVLRKEDLENADEIILFNSVRKAVTASLS